MPTSCCFLRGAPGATPTVGDAGAARRELTRLQKRLNERNAQFREASALLFRRKQSPGPPGPNAGQADSDDILAVRAALRETCSSGCCSCGWASLTSRWSSSKVRPGPRGRVSTTGFSKTTLGTWRPRRLDGTWRTTMMTSNGQGSSGLSPGDCSSGISLVISSGPVENSVMEVTTSLNPGKCLSPSPLQTPAHACSTQSSWARGNCRGPVIIATSTDGVRLLGACTQKPNVADPNSGIGSWTRTWAPRV